MFNIGVAALWRLRGFLQVAIPAVVAADTVRSFFKCHQLYQERLQEWRQEEEQEIYGEVVAALRCIAARCQARNKDFWPAAITQAFQLGAKQLATQKVMPASSALGIPSGRQAAESGGNQQGAVPGSEPAAEAAVGDAAVFLSACLGELEQLELPLEAAPPSSSAPAAVPAWSAEAALPSSKPTDCAAVLLMPGPSVSAQQAKAGRPVGEAASLATAAAEEAAAAGPPMHDPYGPGSPGDIGNTPGRGAGCSRAWAGALAGPSAALRAGWGHALAALRALREPAALTHSVHSALVEQHARSSAWLEERIADAAEALRTHCEGSLPWPQVELRRASALRFRVRWHGLRWPEALPARGGGVELDLDGL